MAAEAETASRSGVVARPARTEERHGRQGGDLAETVPRRLGGDLQRERCDFDDFAGTVISSNSCWAGEEARGGRRRWHRRPGGRLTARDPQRWLR